VNFFPAAANYGSAWYTILARYFPSILWGICIVVILTVISAGLLAWLWNWTVPGLFKLPALTFWQALRLQLIAALLLGALRTLPFASGSNGAELASGGLDTQTRLAQVNDILLEAERTERAADAHLRESLRLLAALQPAIPSGSAPAP